MSYQAEVEADRPLVYYRIDDAGSETKGAAEDLGSLKLNGTYNGTVPLVAGALESSGDADKAGSWTGNIANFIDRQHLVPNPSAQHSAQLVLLLSFHQLVHQARRRREAHPFALSAGRDCQPAEVNLYASISN